MNKIKVLLLGVLAVFFIDSSEHQVRVATDYIKRSPHSHAKPGAAIALDRAQVNLEVSGVQYAIDPGLLSGYDGEQLELSVTTSDGLYIVGGDTNPTMTLSKGKLSCPFNVMATENGRYYLYLNAKVDNGETRALTFIVQVGEEQSANNASAALQKVSSGGEILVPLSAKEEIIQH